MPLFTFNRSRITGEVIDDTTLALAAETHGIKLSETSVGRMFQYSEDTGQFGRKEAAKKVASNRQSSFKEGIIKSESKIITSRDRRLNRLAGNVGQSVNIPELGGMQYITKKLKPFPDEKKEGIKRWEVESMDGQPSEVVEHPDGTFKMA